MEIGATVTAVRCTSLGSALYLQIDCLRLKFQFSQIALQIKLQRKKGNVWKKQIIHIQLKITWGSQTLKSLAVQKPFNLHRDMKRKILTDMRGWEDTSSSHWTVPHREELLSFTSQLQKKKHTHNTNNTINLQN